MCVAIGSKLFDIVVSRDVMTVERCGFLLLLVAAFVMSVAGLVKDHTVRLVAFCGFELACGVYYPLVATLRSRYIPEECRATVMNLFRVPLNAIVVFVLLNISRMSEFVVFVTCTLCLIPAILVQRRLAAAAQGEAEDNKNSVALATM